MRYFFYSLLLLTFTGKVGRGTIELTSNANTTASTAAPNYLKLHYFEEGMQLWRVKLSNNLQELKTEYITASINVVKFSRYLERAKFHMPIQKRLRSEWVLLLEELGEQATGAILFEKMLQQERAYWRLLNTPAQITAHYYTHSHYYKRLDLDEDDLADKELPQKSFFVQALQASIAPGEFQAIQEELRRVAALNQRAELYQTRLHEWFTGEIKQINLLYRGVKKPPVYSSCLEVEANSVAFANLPKGEKEQLLQTIKRGCQENSNTQGVISWKKAMKEVRTALYAYRDTKLEQQPWQQHSKEAIQQMTFPTDIGLWVVHCDSITRSQH